MEVNFNLKEGESIDENLKHNFVKLLDRKFDLGGVIDCIENYEFDFHITDENSENLIIHLEKDKEVDKLTLQNFFEYQFVRFLIKNRSDNNYLICQYIELNDSRIHRQYQFFDGHNSRGIEAFNVVDSEKREDVIKWRENRDRIKSENLNHLHGLQMILYNNVNQLPPIQDHKFSLAQTLFVFSELRESGLIIKEINDLAFAQIINSLTAYSSQKCRVSLSPINLEDKFAPKSRPYDRKKQVSEVDQLIALFEKSKAKLELLKSELTK